MKSFITSTIMSCAVRCFDHSVSERRTARYAYRVGYGLESLALFLNGNWAALAERQNELRDQQEAEALWRASSAA